MLSQSLCNIEQQAHVPSANDLAALVQGYRLCARTEGKSDRTIAIVANSVTYLDRFLSSEGLPTTATAIGPMELRAFILHLQQKRCFSGHPLNRALERGLSGHTINCYLRSTRAFWSWLVSEGFVDANPFVKLRLPRAPQKVIPTFSDLQLQQLLAVIDTSTAGGYRDQAIILTLLDTALRVSELASATLDNLWLEDGVIRIMGKGCKERFVPIGRRVQRVLWRYISRYRPQSAQPNCDLLFLTVGGMPMTKDRIDKMMARHGRKAGVKGVRCSPHTLRHTASIRFLRNGGDVFSLQRMLGHSSLEMTRRYCQVADIDVKNAHVTASPVDNLALKPGRASVPPSHQSYSPAMHPGRRPMCNLRGR